MEQAKAWSERPEWSEEELVAEVRSARRIFVAGSCGFPARLVEILDRHGALQDQHVTCATVPGFGHVPPRVTSGERRVFFASPRGSDDERFVPIQYRRLWDLLAAESFDLVLMRFVSTADGDLRYGLGVDFQPAVLRAGVRLCAEVEEEGPSVANAPVPEVEPVGWITAGPAADLAAMEPGGIERRIGEHVAALVDDGDCLQLGVGSVPDAVLEALSSHRHLGVHSGMVSNGVRRLVERGVVDGSRKSLDQGLCVSGFVLGDEATREWARQEPSLALRPVEYTHDARVLARIEHLVSINSAIEVDLFGQVNAESIQGRQVSGTGGSVDFARGAAISPGGRSIVALPSTAGGRHSRIVPAPFGAPATSLRTDVDFVVTEHGVARLRGEDLLTRARNLASVADPRFRDELLEQVPSR